MYADDDMTDLLTRGALANTTHAEQSAVQHNVTYVQLPCTRRFEVQCVGCELRTSVGVGSMQNAAKRTRT